MIPLLSSLACTGPPLARQVVRGAYNPLPSTRSKELCDLIDRMLNPSLPRCLNGPPPPPRSCGVPSTRCPPLAAHHPQQGAA